MLNILVWSKNRPAQLELCLRSIREQFEPENKITVQYDFDTEDFKKGYDKVISEYPGIVFKKESHFAETAVSILNGFDSKYCLFLCDDDVFIDKVSKTEYDMLVDVYEKNNLIHCISLRMNKTINFCNPANTAIQPPAEWEEQEKYLLWHWKQNGINQFYCWGYPMSAVAHIYETKKIRDLIGRLDFHNVNSLESRMNGRRWFDRPLLLSFKESKVLNVQNNFVQGNRVSEVQYEHSIESLNRKFLDGFIISTENIYGLKLRQAHAPVDYKLVKPGQSPIVEKAPENITEEKPAETPKKKGRKKKILNFGARID